VLRQYRRSRPTLSALILALCVPSMAARVTTAEENQKPDKHPTAGTKAGSFDAERAQTLSRILGNWKARQDRVKSFHFSWDTRITLPKGYLFPTYWNNPVVGGLKDGGMAIAEKGVELTIPRSEFWVDGKDRVRDEFFTVICKGLSDWPRAARIRMIVDGTTISRLTMPTAPGESPVIAIWGQTSVKGLSAFPLRERGSRPDPRTYDWKPLCLAFRPLDQALGWPSVENCRIVAENDLVDGVRCVEVQMDAVDHSQKVWVDPSRDDIAVRWERRQGFASPTAVAIEYQRDKEHGWVPSRWKRQLPGQPDQKVDIKGSLEATVTHYSINEKFPSDTFARSFPSGTRVCDVSAELIPADKNRKPGEGKHSTMEAIVAAWTRRQEKAKSVQFSWREEQEPSTLASEAAPQPKEGAHTILIDGERFAYIADDRPYPPEVASTIIERELSTADQKKRPGRGGAQSTFPPARITFDGTTTRTYRALNHPTLTGIGSTRSGFSIPQARDAGTEPVLLAFRPFDPHLGRINPADYSVSENRGKIGEALCLIIEINEQGPERAQTSYWLDPTRDYIVLRKHRMADGRDVERTDISYRNDPVSGWVPNGCQVSSLTVGSAERMHTYAITNLAVNRPIPSAEFLVDFPKGTKVHEVPAQSGGGGGIGGFRLTAGAPVRRARRRTAIPDSGTSFKPIFDRFADAVADVEAAVKTANETHQKVLLLFGDNSLSNSLSLYPILKDDAELGPFVDKSFILVPVDLYSESGVVVAQRYFQIPHRITQPHIGVLDSKREALQFQNTNWFEGDDGNYDPHRIKQLLSYFLKPVETTPHDP